MVKSPTAVSRSAGSTRIELSEIPQQRPERQYARDDFEFGSLLGIGALAQVVHVRDTYTGEEYALKILDKKQLRRFGKVSQIINEKEMLSKMEHPGIVKLYFTFQDSTWLYLALELCPNGELAELIARKGRLPLALVRFYAGEMVNILTYLRKLGIAHRDIKPENIFISESGHLKLGDFDTAKIVAAGTSDQQGLGSADTKRMNTFVGTAQYVSPEMLHDSAIAGFGSDLWALGCVAFQMLTGVPPFKSNSEYNTFQKILATDYSFPENIADVGQRFVRSLLALDPQDRLGFFKIDELRQHEFFSGIELDELENLDPPLDGVLRLRRKRIRMSSDSVEAGCENVFLDSSDEEDMVESSQLLDEELINLFSGAAPQSPTLVRCATTAPYTVTNSDDETSSVQSIMIQRRASADGSSTPSESLRTTPVAFNSGLIRKAASSPALFSIPQIGRSGSFTALPNQEELQRTTSSVDVSHATKSWASGRYLSSKPSVIVESLMTRHSIESEDVSPENRPRPSPHHGEFAGGVSDSGIPMTFFPDMNTVALSNYLQRICASDEHILMSGQVLKRRFFGRNRILVITDLPRLLVIEPKTFRTVCEIPLLSAPNTVPIPFYPTSGLLLSGSSSDSIQSSQPVSGLAVCYVSSTEFTISTETSSWRGEVMDGTAQAWVSLIQAMKQKAIKTASLRPPRNFGVRAISPEEESAREILQRGDFGSSDIMGAMFSRTGISSDLPSKDELDAEAEARVDAALKVLGSSSDLSDPDALVAALGRELSRRTEESPATKGKKGGDIFSNQSKRRTRKDSSSCTTM